MRWIPFVLSADGQKCLSRDEAKLKNGTKSQHGQACGESARFEMQSRGGDSVAWVTARG